MAEVHREIASGNWRPPHKDSAKGAEPDVLSGFARRCLAERDLTPHTREEHDKLLEGLILPTLGKVQLRHLEPDQIRRWYSTVLSDDRPPNAGTPTHCFAPSCGRPRTKASSSATPVGSGTPAESVEPETSNPPHRRN